MKWKSPAPPSHTHWNRDVLYFPKLEKIRLSKVWCLFFKCIKNTKFSDIPRCGNVCFSFFALFCFSELRYSINVLLNTLIIIFLLFSSLLVSLLYPVCVIVLGLADSVPTSL